MAKANGKGKARPAAEIVEVRLWAPMEFCSVAAFGRYVGGSEAWYVVDLATVALESGDKREREAAVSLVYDFQEMVSAYAALRDGGKRETPIRVEIEKLSTDPETRFERLGHLLALASRIEDNGGDGALSDWAKRIISGLAAEMEGTSYRLRMIESGREAA